MYHYWRSPVEKSNDSFSPFLTCGEKKNQFHLIVASNVFHFVEADNKFTSKGFE